MKNISLIIFVLCFSSTVKAQEWKLPLIINNIVPQNPSIQSDSIIVVFLLNAFPDYVNRVKYPTKTTNGVISLDQILNIPSFVESLGIYFNKNGYIQINDIQQLRGDSLTIDILPLYSDCIRNGNLKSERIYHYNKNGEIDFLNYEEKLVSNVDEISTTCQIPDTLSLTVNDSKYLFGITENKVITNKKTGQGKIRKHIFGKKFHFSFQEIEFQIISTANINVK